MSKKNILMVFGEPFMHGGQEAFALNLYKFINKNEFKIDFYTPYNLDNDEGYKLLEENGSKLYFDNYNFNSKLRKKYFTKGFSKFMREHKEEYDIVHINSGSTYVLGNGSKIAKTNGIKKVIAHSHSTGVPSILHNITNKLQENRFKYTDIFLACSYEAAKFRFPKTIIEKKQYVVIKNGINLNLYQFNKEIRSQYRNKLKLKDDEILLGNVGRLSFPKNQLFLIDILKKLNENIKFKYKLLLVGEGNDLEKINSKINYYGLDDKVIILSKRSDVNNLLMAMDIFLFPSNFEGVGIAALEAIASGLPTLCSDNVPINYNFENFEKLKLDLDTWITKIKDIKIERTNNNLTLLKKYGFDSIDSVKVIENIYRG